MLQKDIEAEIAASVLYLNRISDFHSFICSLFPKATFFILQYSVLYAQTAVILNSSLIGFVQNAFV